MPKSSMRVRPGQQMAKIPPQDAAAGDPITIGADKSININLSKLSPPSHIYDADHAWVVHSGTRVSLVFGKKRLDNPEILRTRLEIRYPPEDFVRQFWRNSRGFHESLRSFISQWPSVTTPVTQKDLPPTVQADKDHSEWANFDYMAFAGSGGAIDFYQLPASGIARFAQGGGSAWLIVTPVVRVLLTAFELAHLLEEAGQIIPEIVSYLPEKEHKWLKEHQEEHA